jgi:hypothetical protein
MEQETPMEFPWVIKARERAARLEFMKSFKTIHESVVRKEVKGGEPESKVRIWTEDELHKFYGVIF